jgi:hypothetical protein
MRTGFSAARSGPGWAITSREAGTGGLGRRLLWFAGLYLAGVAVTGAAALLIRLMIHG